MKLRITILAIIVAASLHGCRRDNHEPEIPKVPDNVTTYGISSAVALSPMGKTIAYDGYPAPRTRKVGMFYFVWHGHHGYDTPGNLPVIQPPTAADANSPYDISELEKGISNPQDVPFGGAGKMHHWGKPALGYYVSNDVWVIRKHAQMLSGAGIDVIFIDLTNGLSYLPTLRTICDVYKEMIREGNKPPQISFILNSSPEAVMPDILSLHSVKDYDNIWFKLAGKPLLLAPVRDYGAQASAKFTFRTAWFDSQFGYGGSWYGDGSGKWTWGEFYPQRNIKEEMSVMVASHPLWNIGRSYSGPSPSERGGSQPQNPTAEQRAEGTYFKQQFEHALQCDPDLIFLTGWNEWTAQQQIQKPGSGAVRFMGKTLKNGDTYFVDCYNHEFSRDLEPCADDFKDTYYYYMAEYIRRYKGVTPVAPVSETHSISIDGVFHDWNPLSTRYEDFRFDVLHRNHYGYGYKNISLKNDTGHNDIHICKVAVDKDNIYFYVETVKDISEPVERGWMQLFISNPESRHGQWEGFGYLVNNKPGTNGKTWLQICQGGWSWKDKTQVSYAVKGRQMEIGIPLREIGIIPGRGFEVDFKWIDNAVKDGDITGCMSDGDAAPDNRFRYRFIYRP